MNTKTRIAVFFFFFLSVFISNIILIDQNKIQNKFKTSGALEALHFWNEVRTYPNKAFPSEGFVKAYNYKKEKLSKKNYRVDPNDNWREIGPHNIGGRTISIALNPQNPNTIYAGSASGGLWRSYTAGEGSDAWDYVNTGYPVQGVGAIAFVPDDSLEFYIGTGEVYNYSNTQGGVAVRETRGSYGIGILKTTDGGNTWTKSLDWSKDQQHGVMVIRINPLNKNSAWAGTSDGTYRSFDAGESWVQVNSIIMVTDLLIHPVDTSTVLIACGNLNSNGNGIYLTLDDGDNWDKITDDLPESYGGKAIFSTYKEDSNLIYASIGNGYYTKAGTWLCKSNNFGFTWEIVDTFDYSTYQGWFSHFAVINQNNPNEIIAAGVDVYKSTTGGTNLVQKSYWWKWDFGAPPAGGPEGPDDYSHADHHCFVIHPDDPEIVYLGNDGGIFRTTDFGETFEGLNGGYQTTQFYSGFSSSHTDSILSLGGMQDNSTAIYFGDPEWFRVIGGDGSWTGINQTNNNILYGSYQYLNIRKSTNGGATFYGAAPPNLPNSRTSFIAPFVVGVDNSNVLYAGRSTIFKSTNSAGSWTTPYGTSSISTNPPITMAISYQNTDVVYVGNAPINSSAEIFRTTDGGNSWDNITGFLPDRYPMDIEVDPNNDQNVYVTFAGYGSSHVYKSTDGGDNWIDINNNLPDVPAFSVAIDPDYPEQLYVGNDLGVYFSMNGGESWSDISEGLPEAVMVYNLSIVPSNRSIRIASHGNGVFERKLLPIQTDVENEDENPIGFKLEQNYPNPFNPTTTIKYSIPVVEATRRVVSTKLIVYDILGREVATLVNREQQPGSYEVTFDASSVSRQMTSGVYYYRLNAGSFAETKKMILIK